MTIYVSRNSTHIFLGSSDVLAETHFLQLDKRVINCSEPYFTTFGQLFYSSLMKDALISFVVNMRSLT